MYQSAHTAHLLVGGVGSLLDEKLCLGEKDDGTLCMQGDSVLYSYLWT